MKTKRTWLVSCGLLVLALVGPSGLSAAAPCCGITAIDTKSGVVTMKDTTTGQTFRFKLDDPELIGSLRIGQAVEADFKTMRVTVWPMYVRVFLDRSSEVAELNESNNFKEKTLH